ncbi:MAG: DUF4214 domain-containing protein [Lachnospiraceae bacterium]|nr:DUF4214 domain-containing protein [Lachnospiraceae bacterium]
MKKNRMKKIVSCMLSLSLAGAAFFGDAAVARAEEDVPQAEGEWTPGDYEETLGGPLEEDPVSVTVTAPGGDFEIGDGFVAGAGATSTNRYYEYSGYYAEPVKSYLVPASDGDFYRVEYLEDQNSIVVETYDKQFSLIGSRSIDVELEYFGGFYAGSDAYYFLFGASNTEEDDAKEVYRVVKYNTSWVRQSKVASVYGGNTYMPFRAGSADMVETANYLYVRTCHQMYKSKDGSRHQANVQLVIKKSDMTVSDSACEVTNVKYGYVSHSFNQMIALDGDRIITADHGDAYPRAMVVGYYGTSADKGKIHTGSTKWDLSFTYSSNIAFKGETGANATGAMLGGLEVGKAKYISVGNSIWQNDNYKTNQTHNVWLCINDKGSLTSKAISYLTNYEEGAAKSVSNAHLVKISDDSMVVLWQEKNRYDYSGGYTYIYSGTPVVKFQYLDGGGNPVGGVRSMEANLSDCQPVVIGGKVTWYVTNNSEPVFYTLPDPPDESMIRAYVTRLYQVYLDREPDAAGMEDWVNRLMTGAESATQVTAGFVFSDEFKSKNYCNDHYIYMLYRGMFDREPDDAGFADWQNRMLNGSSREAIFMGFAGSEEFKNLCSEYGMEIGDPIDTPQYGTIPSSHCQYPGCTQDAGVAEFVERMYVYALERESEPKGKEDWIGRLVSHESTGRQVVFGFLYSDEFNGKGYDDERYLLHLYKTIFGREPDEEGRQHWLNKLQNEGYTRMDVLNSFADSEEFLKLCNRYGIPVGDRI